ncbi:hypothetical protein BDZ45DRAFT_691217 [Acephala macrosclerotiorum]|nr:hypothetical protein BDZ45DRAFT_691217 [Acephala macrosclerotiorum]
MPFRYSLRALISRQSSTEVPAVCYAACNDCYIEAQKIGLVPALCASNSPFELSYSACAACVTANGDTAQNSTSVITLSELDPYVNFCKGAAAQASADAIFSSFAASVTVTQSVYVTVSGSSTGSNTSSPDTSNSKHRSYAWIAGLLVGVLVLLAAIVLPSKTTKGERTFRRGSGNRSRQEGA